MGENSLNRNRAADDLIEDDMQFRGKSPQAFKQFRALTTQMGMFGQKPKQVAEAPNHPVGRCGIAFVQPRPRILKIPPRTPLNAGPGCHSAAAARVAKRARASFRKASSSHSPASPLWTPSSINCRRASSFSSRSASASSSMPTATRACRRRRGRPRRRWENVRRQRDHPEPSRSEVRGRSCVACRSPPLSRWVAGTPCCSLCRSRASRQDIGFEGRPTSPEPRPRLP